MTQPFVPAAALVPARPTRKGRAIPARLSAIALACGLAAFAAPTVAGEDCRRLGFPVSGPLLFGDPATPVYVYSLDGGGSFQLQIWNSDQPGSFDLAGGGNESYATCEQCVLLFRTVGDAEKTFFQSQGTLAYTEAPGAATLALDFNDVRLVEVTIDPVTFESVPVPGGACYRQAPPGYLFDDGFEGT